MKAKPLEATLLPLAFDPGCSDHDSPADDREAQAHEEVRMPIVACGELTHPPNNFVPRGNERGKEDQRIASLAYSRNRSASFMTASCYDDTLLASC